MSDTGDYISRDAAIEAMYKDAEAHPGHTFWTSQFESLMDIPAADVRPVVFCKDCKWYQIDELKKDGTEDRRYKPSVCVLAEQRRDPNHFCADGKKREES